MYADTIQTRVDDETGIIEPRKTHPHYLTADEHRARLDRVKALLADGLQRQQICAATGLGRTILNLLMRKHGLKSAPKPIESPKALRLAALLKDGYSRSDCVREMGVTRSAISQMVRYHKLEETKKVAPPPPMDDRARQVAAMLADGRSRKECRAELGIGKGAIDYIMRCHGLHSVYKRRVAGPRDARDEIIAACYPAGEERAAILAKCNALPGEPVGEKYLKSRVKVMKVTRPPGFRAARMASLSKAGNAAQAAARAARPPKPPRPVAAPKPVIAQPTRILPQDPPPNDWCPGGARIPVSRKWDDIRGLALNDGFALMSLHDLPSYNKSRIRRNLAPYAVVMGAKQPDEWR